jgi:hypothetical protein
MPRGWPTLEVTEAPGLFFVGYFAKVSGQLRLMRFEARRVARAVKGRTRTARQAEAAESALTS